MRDAQNGLGDRTGARDRDQTRLGDRAHDLPGMLSTAEEQGQQVPVGDGQGRRGPVALLALRMGGRRVL